MWVAGWPGIDPTIASCPGRLRVWGLGLFTGGLDMEVSQTEGAVGAPRKR